MAGIKTMIIGATTNSTRYAYKAAEKLTEHGHEIVPIGIKQGVVFGVEIINGQPKIEGIHTVTLYLGKTNQPEYYDYIISLKPKRVIFNPGTENEAFEALLAANGIEAIEACTLVMLSIGNYTT